MILAQLQSENDALRARLAAVEGELQALRQREADARPAQEAAENAPPRDEAGGRAARFKALFDNLPMRAVIYRLVRDEQGGIVDWEIGEINPLGAESLGRPAPELIGQRAVDVFGAAVMRPYLALCREVAASGQPRVFETHFETNQRDYMAAVFLVGPDHYANVGMDISEIKRAERERTQEQMRASQLRLELAVRGANAGLWDWIIPTEELIINERWASMLGYSMEELAPITIHTWERLCEPGDLLNNQRQLDEHFAHRSDFYEIETRMRHKNGEWVWVLTSGQVTEWDGGGRPLRMNGTHIDVTARKRAEAALRASEEENRVLLQTLDDVIATLDRDGRVQYANTVAAAALGLAVEQVVGRTIEELLPQPTAARYVQEIREVLASDQARVFEELSVFQGQPRWRRTTLQPLHDEQGSVIQVLVNSTDIHALKSAQEELLELNRTLDERIRQRTAEVQELYDSAPAGYESLDEEARVIMVNQTELEWLGYTREEMIGVPIGQFLAPASRALYAEHFAAIKERGAASDMELELVRKDGSILPVLANAVAEYDAEGRFVRSKATLVDNTVRKAALEAQRRANLEIEQAMRLKDEFLANMSHELRTPLNTALMLTEVLQDQIYGPLSERQLKAVGDIDTSARHLLSLINDLLDLSKIGAGKFSLNLEMVAVDEICKASLLFLREAAMKKGLAVHYGINLQGACMQADARRLKQMLVNLLGNAVKFTPAGGRVGLEVTVEPDAGRIRFAVQDTGPGIAPEEQPKLFQSFVQLDSPLTQKVEGTGLGLALVQQLARQHGGEVRVESRGVPGEGSRFTITLPYGGEEGAAPAAYEEVQAAPPAAGETRPLVLLADDDELTGQVMCDYLKDCGYAVLFARNGEQALEYAGASLPALMLVDIQMPVMDGLEVIRRVRGDVRLRGVPIIAVTALAMSGDRERCLAAGADEYMSKPVGLVALAGMIKSLVKGGGGV